MINFFTKARFVGKSVGLIIPKTLCVNYEIKPSEEIILVPTENGILITTKKLQEGNINEK